MKINMGLLELSYLYSIVQLVPRKDVEVARSIFKSIEEAREELVQMRMKLIKKYCEQKEVDIEQEDKSMKKEMRMIPVPETVDEYLEAMRACLATVEFTPLAYPILKNTVLDFENIYIDPNTGERGLKGEQEKEMYEMVIKLFK